MNVEHLLNLHRTNSLFLRWALLIWILAIAAGFALDSSSGKAYAEPLYQTVSLAGLLGLVLYGLLNIYFGVIKDFSFGQILMTTAALFIGGVGIAAIVEKQGGPLLALGSLLFLLGIAAVWHGQARRQKSEACKGAVFRPLNDASIRGGVSVFQYGHDAFRMVERNSTGRNTPAEQFEKKLIRYIERKLEVEPVSMKGSNASYWNIRMKSGGRAELIVLGPGYNTSARLREGERWLLRIREAKPGFFTQWIARHFPEGVGITRDLGAEMQTQFASSQAADEKGFFDQSIEVPFIGIQVSLEAALELIGDLQQAPASTDTPDEAATEKTDKPILH